MNLDSEELEGLAAVLERRFPPGNPRQQLLGEAGVDNAESWSTIVRHAADSGALPRLVGIASRMRPDDENLKAVSEALGAGMPREAFVAAGAVLVLLGVGAVAWYTSADDKINAIADEPVVEAPAEQPVLRGQPVTSEKPPTLSGAPDLTPSLVPPFARQRAEEGEPEPVDESPEASGVVEGRCGGERGELVGYWYAGFPFDVTKGDAYTIKHGANVRKDHPSKENGWSSSAPIICVTTPGAGATPRSVRNCR